MMPHSPIFGGFDVLSCSIATERANQRHTFAEHVLNVFERVHHRVIAILSDWLDLRGGNPLVAHVVLRNITFVNDMHRSSASEHTQIKGCVCVCVSSVILCLFSSSRQTETFL